MGQSGSERSCDATPGPSNKRRKTVHSLHELKGSSKYRGKRLCDGVYSLHEPEGRPEVEMVFIHGLQGSIEDAYWTTWLARHESQDNCWPMTWLAAKFPKARILSVSYDANRALKSSSLGTMDLYPYAETLLHEMVFSGVGIGQDGCPVVFVCHCLGGLIAKKIVVLGHERFKGNERIEKLLHNIEAFVFYGTPHGRSELVSEKAEVEVGRLNSAFERIQREVYSNKWRFRVVAETHATSHNWLSSSMLVKEPSARHVGYEVMHVAADHFDVCKPKSKDDTIFIYLTGLIGEVVADRKNNFVETLELPNLVVGIDDKLKELHEKLKISPIVGLVGMGGVGKTTLSKAMYNWEWKHYTRCSYLDDVKSHSNILGFQKQLLRELCGEKWDDNEDPKVYMRKIKQCIQTSNVLVVIDDVGSERNLKALHVDAFQKGSSGSKLIITCRKRGILREYLSEGEQIEVAELNYEQSMKLFSHYAFCEFNLIEERGEFESEGAKIVSACGGLPLSIEIIGQHLRKQNRLPKDERLQMWKEALKRLKGAVAFEGHNDEDEKLWRKLMISYNDLGSLEKGFFLDFACVLCEIEGLDMNTVVRIWDSRGGLLNLIDSSLIKVASKQLTQESSFYWDNFVESQSHVQELVIHDQLRDMGRWIVKDLGRRDSQKHVTHIWEKDEVNKLLLDNRGSRTLESLFLMDVKGTSQAFMNGIPPSQQIQQYPNLRLLNLSQLDMIVATPVFHSCLVDPGNLRWLCLDGTQITMSLSEILGAKFKTLCVLHMRDWREVIGLPASICEISSLKELDLGGWLKLQSLPSSIGKLGNLQVLVLKECEQLIKLPESIGDLVHLLELDLSECRRLERLPCAIANLKLLKLLYFRMCVKLEVVPAGVGQLMKLEMLDLHGCSALRTMCEFETEMHHLHTLQLRLCKRLESFKGLGNLTRLRTLDLKWCKRLCIADFAECVCQLRYLQFLDLGGCSLMVKEVAEAVGKGNLCSDRLEALYLPTIPEAALPVCPYLKFLELRDEEAFKELRLSRVASLSESVGNLTQLKRLGVLGVTTKSLPDGLKKLVRLEFLRVAYGRFERLPEHVGDLLSLRRLSLEGCSELVELPLSLGHLSQLQSLDLMSCSKLERLPESLGGLTQLQYLDVSYCEKLERLPDSLGGLTQLQSLHVSYCEKLECLPDSLGGLTQLQYLHVECCSKLECLPDSLGGLAQLQDLFLMSSSNLERLPESLGGLTQLRSLHLRYCQKLERLPDSLGGLTQLHSLYLSYCEKLECLPDSLGGLAQLQSLDLRSCSKLERLPESLGGLTQLQILELSFCSKLERLPESLGGLTQLRSLHLRYCQKLERLPDSLGGLTQLHSLYLSYCEKLECLPDSLGGLAQLQSLHLSYCKKLECLPDSLGGLTQLQSLDLECCSKLERLPESLGGLTQLRSLHLRYCQKLERLPDSLGGLTQLHSLDLSYCEKLECLPDFLGGLAQLQSLDLECFSKLERLPESLGGLTQLQRLELSFCSKLERLPESLGGLTQLRSLHLRYCQKLERLPDSLGGLTQLHFLYLSYCEKLECLPDSLGGLAQLQSLDLECCSKLERLPESLGGLTQLQYLDLSFCSKLERLPESLGGLTQFRVLKLLGCKKRLKKFHQRMFTKSTLCRRQGLVTCMGVRFKLF